MNNVSDEGIIVRFYQEVNSTIAECNSDLQKFTFSSYLKLFLKQRNLSKKSRFWDKLDWDKVDAFARNNSFSYSFDQKGLTISSKNLNEKYKIFELLCERIYNEDDIDDDVLYNAAFDYLSAYSAFADRLEKANVLRDSIVFSTPFLDYLRAGYICDEIKISKNCNEKKQNFYNNLVFYRFHSPIILENLCIGYDYLKRGRKSLNSILSFEKKNNISDIAFCVLKNMICDVASKKMERCIKNDIISNSNRFVSIYDNVPTPLRVKRSDLSGIEFVRPIRWMDKIRAFIERQNISETEKIYPPTIKIGIFGYVKVDEYVGVEKNFYSIDLDLLCSSLYSEFGKEYNFIFHIIVNKNDPYFKYAEFGDEDVLKYKPGCDIYCPNIEIDISKADYGKIFSPNPKGIRKYIKENEILLILDVPNLYSYEYRLIQKAYFPVNSDSEDPYREGYNGINFESILLSENIYDAPIHAFQSKLNVISLNADAYNDILHYQLRDDMIEVLRRYVLFEEKKTDMHILVSYKKSIEYSEIAKKNFARVERNNGKTFGLITARNADATSGNKLLVKKGKKNYIIFSLWNLIKNIDIDITKNKEFISFFYGNASISESETKYYQGKCCYDTMHIYLKMTWKNGFEQFNFEIFDEHDNRHKNNFINLNYIKSFLEKLFSLIFRDDNDLVLNCMRSSFYKTIYSQIEYLDDVVFFCLLQTRRWRIIKPTFEVALSEFVGKPKLSVNEPERWVQIRAIDKLQSSRFYDEQLQSIKRDFRCSGMADYVNEFFHDLYFICEKYHYTDTILYNNVIDVLNGIY